MAFQKKHLFGFVPFWPTYPVGFYLGVVARELPQALRGHSGSRYLNQRHAGRWAVLLQVPRAVAMALRDEAMNVWRARYNNRVV